MIHAPGATAGSTARNAPAQSECSPKRQRRPGTKNEHVAGAADMRALPCRVGAPRASSKRNGLAHRGGGGRGAVRIPRHVAARLLSSPAHFLRAEKTRGRGG